MFFRLSTSQYNSKRLCAFRPARLSSLSAVCTADERISSRPCSAGPFLLPMARTLRLDMWFGRPVLKRAACSWLSARNSCVGITPPASKCEELPHWKGHRSIEQDGRLAVKCCNVGTGNSSSTSARPGIHESAATRSVSPDQHLASDSGIYLSPVAGVDLLEVPGK